ncbi:hypothetical protein TSUD_314950 [Trifolium subterraneum]|uniref:Uncharacterized protein n=1 Tax=Trifolium subterraneum TaxID=3900 RepID=A0A2Z6M5X7_TRISU|nr:hypothetical protein TSUD_314950 [Trifolium subterraneum]
MASNLMLQESSSLCSCLTTWKHVDQHYAKYMDHVLTMKDQGDHSQHVDYIKWYFRISHPYTRRKLL